MNPKSKLILMTVGIICGTLLLFGLIIGGFAVGQTNKINRKYQAVKMQYSQVETVLQRRYDLLPNLTNTVRGSMKQEREVFGEIAKARQNYSNAKTPSEKFKADREIDRSTNLLINAIHEKYPNLVSNKQVSDLMIEIEGSENRISTERQNYNQTVRDYNTTITSFPGSMFAGNRQQEPYFKADPSAENAPRVDLEH